MTAAKGDKTGKDLLAGLGAAIAAGQAAEALAIIQRLPDNLRERFDIMAHEADLSGKLGRHDKEIVLLRQLISREPAMASLHLSMAQALKTLSQREEAIVAAGKALTIAPGDGRAWWTLAEFKNYLFDDSQIEAMETALTTSASNDDCLHLHFALGRAFEQRGQPENAFAHYAAGNQLGRAAASNEPPLAGRVDRSIALFTPDFFAERTGFGDLSDAPISIVGLHRSDSTLVEQILASHSKIEATAELPLITQLFLSVGRDGALPGDLPLTKLTHLGPQQARALGAEYLRRAQDYRSSSSPHFIDKMPANWLLIGFIQLILPNATIIGARRHPMAAGFSNFRQNYGQGVGWAYALEDIGAYYRHYLRLMRHFDRILPGKVHRVTHERLVENFEPEVRRLLDHGGVPFEPACLEFHRSGRPVRSASAEQVRRPLSREGVDQWLAFEPWLGPLKEALGDALEDWQE